MQHIRRIRLVVDRRQQVGPSEQPKGVPVRLVLPLARRVLRGLDRCRGEVKVRGMQKLIISLTFLVFGSLAYGEFITIENKSNFPVKIKFDNTVDPPKKFTLPPLKTFRFEQGGNSSNGNGTFYVTGPLGLSHGPWNPRKTNYKAIRLSYSGKWKVSW